MANTYPLKPIQPTKPLGRSPMAVTNEADQYKKFLGTQVASVEVGLFYQLNQVAGDVTEEAKMQGQTANGRTPIEANSAYA